jgi:hypothetical protein
VRRSNSGCAFLVSKKDSSHESPGPHTSHATRAPNRARDRVRVLQTAAGSAHVSGLTAFVEPRADARAIQRRAVT